jgi:hypothetical protein
MKLKQIFRENTELTEYDKFFSGGKATMTANGIDVDGDANLKEGLLAQSMRSLPFKMNNVTGSFDVSNAIALADLKNFPRSAKEVILSNCKSLQSLMPDPSSPMSCDFLEVSGAPIKDLSGIDQIENLAKITILNCPEITTLKGLTAQFRGVKITRCPKLVDDIKNYTNVSQFIIAPYSLPLMPIVRATLYANESPTVSASYTDAYKNDKLNMIFEKYKGKGSHELIELINELRDLDLRSSSAIF